MVPVPVPAWPFAARSVAWLLLCAAAARAFALPGVKLYRRPSADGKALQPEPTCEELKAMWRFSKRQSRAAELTNELPMYRDPFANNVWEPYYATSRSVGGPRIAFRTKPVIYGRVVHNPPYDMRFQNPQERQKLMEELTRLYGMPAAHTPQPRRRLTTFRLPGGGHLAYPPQQGSFNHLKELIKTERARELQQQRIVEESAARAAALKDIARNSPGHYTTDHFAYEPEEPEEMMYASDEPEEEDEAAAAAAAGDRGGVIPFPDLLAPAAAGHGGHPDAQVARFSSDYGAYRRGAAPARRARQHQVRPVFDAGSYHDAYGYML